MTADVIAAEDTRRTRALAAALDVRPEGRIVSFYDAVELDKVPMLMGAIWEGETVLLVTDAGMPSVSDPGFSLVNACLDAGLPVTCLPGPSAVTTALALSGLPADRFCFEGFVPRKDGARRAFFRELAYERRTTVFFESPHRLARTLADAAEVLGEDRVAAVCRELTKRYEEVRRAPLGELADWAAGGVKGEITVVLAPAEKPPPPDVEELVPYVEAEAMGGERLKDVAASVAQRAGVSARDLYNAVLAAKERRG